MTARLDGDDGLAPDDVDALLGVIVSDYRRERFDTAHLARRDRRAVLPVGTPQECGPGSKFWTEWLAARELGVRADRVAYWIARGWVEPVGHRGGVAIYRTADFLFMLQAGWCGDRRAYYASGRKPPTPKTKDQRKAEEAA